MHDCGTILSARETDKWVQDRRERLAGSVRRASSPSIRLLHCERLTPARLLALAAREIHDPDWRSGFLHRCTIVVRPEGAGQGRLGLWDSDGTLCLETRVGAGVLILRGPEGELRVDHAILPAGSACSASRLRKLAGRALDGWRGRILAVDADQRTGCTIIRFRTAARRFALQTAHGQILRQLSPPRR